MNERERLGRALFETYNEVEEEVFGLTWRCVTAALPWEQLEPDQQEAWCLLVERYQRFLGGAATSPAP